MTDNPYQATETPPRKKKKWAVGQVIGLCLLVVAVPSFGKLKRPTNSTGNLLDDLPFIAGQLFVSVAILVVGLFLLLRKKAT